MQVLDLGCGRHKIAGAFGVDFYKLEPEGLCQRLIAKQNAKHGVDFAWNLEKSLPKKFYGKWDKIICNSLLEHLGNPLQFLEYCKLYLKKGGVLELRTDNADYWGWHFENIWFRKYHATCWDSESSDDRVLHKMLFQKQHLERLLRLAGFQNPIAEYGGCVNTLDSCFGNKFGSLYLKCRAVK